MNFLPPYTIYVQESIGYLRIPLLRSNGSEGTIGVSYEVHPVNASTSDFTPVTGLVTFSNNELSNFVPILIVNDTLAELAEMFTVILTKPVGGVKIGSNNQMNVVIEENDYPYGLTR